MNIFIPNPRLEAELVIRPQIEGYFDCEITHANGTKSKPWDKPQKNSISHAYLNTLFANNFSGNGGFGSMFRLLFNTTSSLAIGPSDTPLAASAIPGDWNANLTSGNTALLLGRPIFNTATKVGTGNVADVDSTTGNAIMTGNWQFAPMPSAFTVREVSLYNNSIGTVNTNWFGVSGGAVWNRIVLSSPIVLSANDVLTMSYTLVIPTLAVTAQTVTLAAQNGMNISGQLKLIGTKRTILGGEVTGAGVATIDAASGTAGGGQGGAIFPGNARGGLITATTFPSVFTNTTGWATNQSSTQAWQSYTSGSFTKTYETVWNTAFATTNFRSIVLYLGGGTNGYQLLLDNQQTKELNKQLTVGWTFAV
jgi:hypothetical protein